MASSYSKVSFRLIIFFIIAVQCAKTCKNGKNRPNVPFVEQTIWKEYSNKTLEMKIFSGIEKESISPVNVTLEIESEMKQSEHNDSEVPIKFSLQLLQMMPLYHLSSPQFSGSVLRKTGKYIQKLLMEMDFEIDEHFKLLSYCTRLSSTNECMATHTLTWGTKSEEIDRTQSFLSFFVALDFEKKNILLCVGNDKNNHALHCYNHVNGLNNVQDFYLNGDILLKVNRTEACMKRMKFNSVSYVNHQLVAHKGQNSSLNLNSIDHISKLEPFLSITQKIDEYLRSIDSSNPITCGKGLRFCEFQKPHCINKTKQCQNDKNNTFTWNQFEYRSNSSIQLSDFPVHEMRDISLKFNSLNGFVALYSKTGKMLDRINFEPKLNVQNESSNQFRITYENQTSKLSIRSTQQDARTGRSFWIYIEFPEDVSNMCLMKESAKIFVSTNTQISFLGYASHSPRHWYSIQTKGASQMRLELQRQTRAPAPVLFPVYSSIPIHSVDSETSNLDISNISLDNCRRIPWEREEVHTEVILSSVLPIILIICFVLFCLIISYKFLKNHFFDLDTDLSSNLATVKKLSLELFRSESKDADLTVENSKYYSKRRNMNYKDQIEHTNVKSFISMNCPSPRL